MLQAAKLIDANGEIYEEVSAARNLVTQQTCCKRAFLRGAFLANGSMSDPKKAYHLEIVCMTRQKAQQAK